MLKYKKMSLFEAPANSILVHATNSMGIWGSGIAKVFKEKYPTSFKHYNSYCKTGNCSGTFYLCPTENSIKVGCLFTSYDYGKNVSNEDEILYNTVLALENFFDNYDEQYEMTIYSNKFNSGLFNVPWEKTEAVLKVFCDRYNLDWVICDPDMKE